MYCSLVQVLMRINFLVFRRTRNHMCRSNDIFQESYSRTEAAEDTKIKEKQTSHTFPRLRSFAASLI
jgi:hypothetical protein